MKIRIYREQKDVPLPERYREIEALCRESDRSFEGFVRLVPPARSGPAAVTVDCLRRVEDDKIVNVQARNEAASVRP